MDRSQTSSEIELLTEIAIAYYRDEITQEEMPISLVYRELRWDAYLSEQKKKVLLR